MSYSEDNTDSIILARMQDNVTNDIEKEEGSFVYDALSPASKELKAAYITDDDILKRTSPFTAKDTDLENITNPVGVTRKDGGKATTQLLVNAAIGTTIRAGTLVQTQSGLIYKTVNDMTITTETTLVDIIASEVGSTYNVPANTIIQMPVITQGIISVTNTSPLTDGYDIENDDSLRQRYFERLRTPATSGNKYQYRNWCKEVTGVGDAKIVPLWNGNGTVKAIIMNSNKRAADTELVQKVKDYIDPQPEGHGEGQAPIGAILTVVSATEKAINSSAKVVLASGYTLQQVQDGFTAAMQKYLNDISFNSTYVSYAKIGNLLFSTPGVLDYDSNSLTLNNGIINLPLADEEIPVLGTINLGV